MTAEPHCSAQAHARAPGFRRLLRHWHRDVGYVCAALTLTYAVSGLAVNHASDWDYNRATVVTQQRLGSPVALLTPADPARRRLLASNPAAVTSAEEALLAKAIGQRLGIPAPPHNTLWRTRFELAVHFTAGDRDHVSYDVRTGLATRTIRKDRPLLRQLNFLHLNEGRRWWTYVADAYALSLVFLTLSGILIVRGPRGLRGRGGLLCAAGALIPLLAVLLLTLL